MSGMTPTCIEEAVSYCPETGVFRWKVDRHAFTAKVGAIAGTYRGGYRVLKFKKKSALAHRVAWKIVTGAWPIGMIDHRNGDPTDNRWENLRLATPSQNQANRINLGKYPKGVSRNSRGGRFKAEAKLNGKHHYFGSFDTPEEAAAAYAVGAKRLHGEFARPSFPSELSPSQALTKPDAVPSTASGTPSMQEPQ